MSARADMLRGLGLTNDALCAAEKALSDAIGALPDFNLLADLEIVERYAEVSSRAGHLDAMCRKLFVLVGVATIKTRVDPKAVQSALDIGTQAAVVDCSCASCTAARATAVGAAEASLAKVRAEGRQP